MRYSRLDAFQTNRQLLIGWIDHIMYSCDGIDEFMNSNYGIQINIEDLQAMAEAELAETYYSIARIRDMLSPESN